MIVLGINAYHGDVSAALVRDGMLVAAVEEERFRRVKHWAGFPEASIRACLSMAGAEPRDVDAFAVSRLPAAHRLRKAWYALRNRPQRRSSPTRARNMRRVGGIAGEVARATGLDEAHVRSRMHWVEHHPAHLASTLLRVALRRGRGLCDRRLRRLREHVGRARRRQHAHRARSRLLSAFARSALPCGHPVSGVPKIRRRIQGDGPGAVRRAAAGEPASAAGSSRAGWRLQARSLLFPPRHGRRRDDVGFRRADDRARLHAQARSVARSGATGG